MKRRRLRMDRLGMATGAVLGIWILAMFLAVA